MAYLGFRIVLFSLFSLLHCFQGRITQQERRRLLKSGYGFDCNCEVCSLPCNLLEQDDKLRVEAFNLSQTCFDLKDSLSSEEMVEVLRKAERWFFLRKSLGYKVNHMYPTCQQYCIWLNIKLIWSCRVTVYWACSVRFWTNSTQISTVHWYSVQCPL